MQINNNNKLAKQFAKDMNILQAFLCTSLCCISRSVDNTIIQTYLHLYLHICNCFYVCVVSVCVCVMFAEQRPKVKFHTNRLENLHLLFGTAFCLLACLSHLWIPWKHVLLSIRYAQLKQKYAKELPISKGSFQKARDTLYAYT